MRALNLLSVDIRPSFWRVNLGTLILEQLDCNLHHLIILFLLVYNLRLHEVIKLIVSLFLLSMLYFDLLKFLDLHHDLVIVLFVVEEFGEQNVVTLRTLDVTVKQCLGAHDCGLSCDLVNFMYILFGMMRGLLSVPLKSIWRQVDVHR